LSVNQSGIRRRISPNEIERSVLAQFLDFVGLGHFIAANVVAILGEFTGFFKAFGSKHGGIAFVYQSVDWPLYTLFKGFIPLKGDPIVVWMTAQCVFIGSSLLYVIVIFLLVKFLRLFSI
jgi:hypothetical protein